MKKVLLIVELNNSYRESDVKFAIYKQTTLTVQNCFYFIFLVSSLADFTCAVVTTRSERCEIVKLFTRG